MGRSSLDVIEWDNQTRFQQISAYLGRLPNPTPWLAIDDDGAGWSSEQRSSLILSEPTVGLSSINVQNVLLLQLESKSQAQGRKMIQGIPVHREVPVKLVGDDWICSDIHGEFRLLQELLATSGFDPAKDRLFMLGDLIDRGPESLHTLEWVLGTPYCHSVLGNHELLFWASYHQASRADKHYKIGGRWAANLSSEHHGILAQNIQEKLPLTITLNTQYGRIGLVHAQAPVGDWQQLAALGFSEGLAKSCTWGGKRNSGTTEDILNIDLVVSGHIACEGWVRRGNQLWIGTLLHTGKPTLIRSRSLMPSYG